MGSAVLTTLVKATVPYAGAIVDIKWPSANQIATEYNLPKSPRLNRGGDRKEIGALRAGSGRGDQSNNIHNEPTASCVTENVHGKFHTLRTCLFIME
eukprot:CAMPEP_0119326972 /NCGR_PEP_ID=MMETSP1333-20130426/69618_1 /TAXON_ID=418940 /ORGANISM="Scyphosphaera apsteinii, Strain RCC1455" /LENGTH=96 /DNA_ID=CAMNT_0007335419 /DNA_START=1024 /DNA_END=1317 /DNA_ORIENTATION=-